MMHGEEKILALRNTLGEINLYLVDGAHLSDWMSEVHEGTQFQADIFVI